MRKFIRLAMALLTIAAMCQERIALADDQNELSDGGQSASTTSERSSGGLAEADEICCRLPSCGSREYCAGCDRSVCCGRDADPPCGMIVSAGTDAFKGISDGSLPSNFGAVFGLNAGTPVLHDFGLGWQSGVSFGAYDLDGHAWELEESQQQIFLTMGVFRNARQDQKISFGVVYDWMFNNNWGVFTNNPTLGQWRGQIEYAFGNADAIGFAGCLRDRNAVQQLSNLVIEDRAINQANLFWHHKFELGADSWLWVGNPGRGRLDTAQGGSLSDCLFGISVQVPLSYRMALYANTSYMHPSAAAGSDASIESTWDVAMGVVWSFGGNAVRHSITGNGWRPYMPLANNSNFLVDQNPTNLPLH